MHDPVNGMEVGGEGSVVLFWVAYKFGEALDGMGWILREELCKSTSYGSEKLL